MSIRSPLFSTKSGGGSRRFTSRTNSSSPASDSGRVERWVSVTWMKVNFVSSLPEGASANSTAGASGW